MMVAIAAATGADADVPSKKAKFAAGQNTERQITSHSKEFERIEVVYKILLYCLARNTFIPLESF